MSSAIPGVLIRFVVQRGIEISVFNFLVTQAKAPLGTTVAIVGIYS